jgi:hypothetical protein
MRKSHRKQPILTSAAARVAGPRVALGLRLAGTRVARGLLVAGIACLALGLMGCSTPQASFTDPAAELHASPLAQRPQPDEQTTGQEVDPSAAEEQGDAAAELSIIEDYRESFVHGSKTPGQQRYIVLHDTEGTADPASVIDWWDSNGNLVAAHFVIGIDGTVYQCVPLDKIAHHAGYGDAGHNAAFNITEDGRDDMAGSTPIGAWAPDYAMNAWSIGIEMVHVSGSGYYPEEQLNALDALIAHIDAYYGFESTIIDHKAWRSGNSDTSPEFSEYLYNYQDHRRHSA